MTDQTAPTPYPGSPSSITDPAAHEPLVLLIGSEDCLDRDCEEYFTEDGEPDPGVERCSHIREGVICQQCSDEPNADGYYVRSVAWTADHAAAAVSA